MSPNGGLSGGSVAAGFPSPCGVRRVKDRWQTRNLLRRGTVLFPSPCGVRRVKDVASLPQVEQKLDPFPSPCGVRRVKDFAAFRQGT